jgi:Immunity protein 35
MPSLNRESAIALARQRIDQLAQAAGDQFEILSDSTREIEQGWVFFFNTADFVRTRNPSSALAGNGPLLVTREGVIHELPSAIPWEGAVRQL